MNIEWGADYIHLEPETDEERKQVDAFKGRAPFAVDIDSDGLRVYEICTAGLTPPEIEYYRKYFAEED